jgi:signal transduction histidine kinase
MAIFNLQSRAKSESKKEESLKTDFVSLSSHQLRTPLSAVKWFTEILLTQRAGKLSKKQLEYLQEIHRSNERAIALVNDLLQVSRVQEKKIHLDLVEMDMPSLVSEVVEANRAAMTNNSITYNFEIVKGPLPRIFVDKIKTRRILQILITNAVKYTPRGGRLEVKLKNGNDQMECSIADTGVGIPADEQGRVFEKFFRSSNAIKIQTDGTGLGLFIAKALVEAQKGKIWFDSAEGKGTTFYFSLPVKVK